MTIVDRGSGPPVVLVPGIQGRWEWLHPGVEALARHCRVITFSLADEPTADGRFDEANGFGSYVDQVAEAMDQAGLERATICGISFGGLIAAAFAARHPARTEALVLASAIPPSWHPDARVRFYLRAPALLSPLFCLASLRMYPEIAAAAGGALAGVKLTARHGWNALRHMFSPARMARRVHLLAGVSLENELTAVRVPTLILTGEPALDRVVPVSMTLHYLTLWPHARVATIPRSGHLGVITRPAEFARLVTSFVCDTGRLTGGPYIEDKVRRIV
jgi:pimeloyl-ACP methyl ester carboxylesterase